MDFGTIVEISLLTTGKSWEYKNITPVGVPRCQGDVVAYKRSDPTNAVLYVSAPDPADGGAPQGEDIWEISNNDPTQASWATFNLSLSASGTLDAGAAPVVPVYGPGWMQAHVLPDATNSVVYVGKDHNVYEFYHRPPGNWSYRNLGTESGDTSLAATRVFGFNRSDGVASYVFWDTEQHLREITLTGGCHWGFDVIPTNGTVYASNDLTAYVRSDNVNAVVFYGTGGESLSGQDVFEASLEPGGTTWQLTDLTTQAAEPVF
jgi:hypothetical protein